MDRCLDHLKKLGFSEGEARTYIALIREFPVTRYQLAQNAKVPDSKIYSIVRRLQNKGLIAAIDTVPPRFVPASPTDLVSELERSAQESLDYLRQYLPSLASRPVSQAVWNIDGYEATLSKATELISGAQEDIVAGLWHQEVEFLQKHLSAAHERGVHLTLLAYDACNIGFGNVKPHGYRESLDVQLEDAHGRWMALVVDKVQALVGQALDQEPTGVWTDHSGLVTVIRKYVLEHFLR